MKTVVYVIVLLSLVVTAAVAKEPWFNRVLITNDDGIDNPRLAVLARAFAEVAEVVVVAPLSNCSGSTNYISGGQREQVAVRPHDLGPGITAWAVDGFPGDCVLLALTGIMADNPPDLVISGVNTGPNLADAYLASGTIGAARLATQQGFRAVAFSNLRDDDPTMMAAVPGWCVDLARGPVVLDLKPGQYLSVNFPAGPADRVRGFCWASLGGQVFQDAFQLVDQEARDHQIWRYRFWFTDGGDQPAAGDVARQRDGWITVSPMRLGDLDEQALQKAGPLPEWEQQR